TDHTMVKAANSDSLQHPRGADAIQHLLLEKPGCEGIELVPDISRSKWHPLQFEIEHNPSCLVLLSRRLPCLSAEVTRIGYCESEQISHGRRRVRIEFVMFGEGMSERRDRIVLVRKALGIGIGVGVIATELS